MIKMGGYEKHESVSSNVDGPLLDTPKYAKYPAGVLSRDEIKKYGLIKNPHYPKWQLDYSEVRDDSYQPASFDLTLGHAHYVYDNSQIDGWQLKYIGSTPLDKSKLNDDVDERLAPYKANPDALVIPPFGSALIQLNEFVDTCSAAQQTDVPAIIVGRFDLKLSIVYKGLISQQATQVEPYYYGHLFCFLHNISSSEVRLSYRNPIATIEFTYLSSDLCATDYSQYLEDLRKDNEAKFKEGNFCTKAKGIIDIRYFNTHPRALPQNVGFNHLAIHTMNQLVETEKFKQLIEKKVKEESLKISFKSFIWPFVAVLIAALIGFFGSSAFTEVGANREKIYQIDQMLHEANAVLTKDNIVLIRRLLNNKQDLELFLEALERRKQLEQELWDMPTASHVSRENDNE